MRLNRIFLTGLAFLIVSGGTGMTVGKVKDNELEENKARYERDIKELNNIINYKDEEIDTQAESIENLESTKEKLLDNIIILEEEIDKYKAENHRLKTRLNEPTKVTPSRGETGRKLVVEATAYTPRCNGCSGITATGIDVRNSITHNGKGIIATDPKVIPLGSIVIINNRKYIAADTGGVIKGNKIDILMGTKSEALQFGRQNITVTVLPKTG